ncbi:hypothetical protein ACVWY3_000868 [Bradyrhizobium sp. USDA 4486]
MRPRVPDALQRSYAAAQSRTQKATYALLHRPRLCNAPLKKRCAASGARGLLLNCRHTFASPRRISPELCLVTPPSIEKRAQARPRQDRVPVHCAKGGNKKLHSGIQVEPSNRPSLRSGWNGIRRALPRERCTIAPVAVRMADARVRLDCTHHRKTWRTDPGRQDHTIWPYANHTCRWRDALAHGCPPCETCRADVARVHRRPARVRDDRDPPLFLGPGLRRHMRDFRISVKRNILEMVA